MIGEWVVKTLEIVRNVKPAPQGCIFDEKKYRDDKSHNGISGPDHPPSHTWIRPVPPRN
jgi:hypothetical protein